MIIDNTGLKHCKTQESTIALLNFGCNEIYETRSPKLVRFSSLSRKPEIFKLFTAEIIEFISGGSIILLKKSNAFLSDNVLLIIIASSNGIFKLSLVSDY